MEQVIKQEIVKALQVYMKQHGLSQADVSKKCGVRKEYLSLILKEGSSFMYDAGNGNVGFIHVKHFLNLAKLCGYQTEPVYWQTQPTSQMQSIIAHLQDAKAHSQTIVIIGETGSGKTHTSQIFASKNPIDTFIITAGSSDSLNDLINKIIETLRITIPFTSKSSKISAIAQALKKLTHLNHKPMLLIDEAEYLKRPSLCAIKEIYDCIHSYCSIVLIGTDQLVANIEKLRKKNQYGIPQFHRRIKFGLRILPNIDRQFLLFTDEFEDRELKKFVLKNCNNYGELHDLLVPVKREAERLKEPLTLNLVRNVLNLSNGDLVW
jgi:DNA transposition AAA+ family ATPase